MHYKICATTCLIGMALDVWAVVNSETTLFSLQFEHTVTRTFLTSSEMKELASNDFLISLLKMRSISESSPFFTLAANSFKVTTAFLLRVDLRFSTNLMISGTRCLTTSWVSNWEWCAIILLVLLSASRLTSQSSDLISTKIFFNCLSGSLNGSNSSPVE